MLSVETNETKKGLGIHARRALAYIVLVIMSFLCLFWFYILFVNATRSKGIYPAAQHTSDPELEGRHGRNPAGSQRHDQQFDRSNLQCSVVYLLLYHDRIPMPSSTRASIASSPPPTRTSAPSRAVRPSRSTAWPTVMPSASS